MYMMNYTNPLTINDFILLLGLKLAVVVVYRFVSETLTWVLFYIATLLFILYCAAFLFQFPFNLENINTFSLQLENPWFLFYCALNIPLFYLIIYLCGIPMDHDHKLFIIALWELIVWLSFIILAIMDFCYYILNFQITNVFYSYLTTGEPPSAVGAATLEPSKINTGMTAGGVPGVQAGLFSGSGGAVPTAQPQKTGGFVVDGISSSKTTSQHILEWIPGLTTAAPATTTAAPATTTAASATTTAAPATTTAAPATTTAAPATTTAAPTTTQISGFTNMYQRQYTPPEPVQTGDYSLKKYV
jgi:hypothetical protein